MAREAEQQRETEVGEFLRARRLRDGQTLSEASRVLCIREAYLKAIEDGRFDALPGPTYVAGFIRTYAEHLGLDGDKVVRQLKAEPRKMDGRAELRFPSPMSEGGMPNGSILLLGIFVALAAYGAWYVSSTRDESIAEIISPLPERLVAFVRGDGEASDAEDPAETRIAAETSQDQGAAPETPSPSTDQGSRPVPGENQQTGIGVASPPDEADRPDSTGLGNQAPAVPRGETDSDWTAASASASSEGQGADDAESRSSIADTTVASGDAEDPADARDALAPDQSPAAGPASTRIMLRANGENWIEIREGGTDRLVVARLFKPGETFDVPDSPDLRLLTGNAGGLEILVDGEPVPPLGAAGMVRRNVPLDAERLRSGELARN